MKWKDNTQFGIQIDSNAHLNFNLTIYTNKTKIMVFKANNPSTVHVKSFCKCFFVIYLSNLITNSMAYGIQRFEAAFTRDLQ